VSAAIDDAERETVNDAMKGNILRGFMLMLLGVFNSSKVESK
jgi:hypothetical protein